VFKEVHDSERLLTERQRGQPANPGTDPTVRLGIMGSGYSSRIHVSSTSAYLVGFRSKADDAPLSVNLVFIEERKQNRKRPQHGLCDIHIQQLQYSSTQAV
jgi:hypothetical protein